MRSPLLACLLAATATATATGCTSEFEDELATEDTTELSDEKADAAGTYTYYLVTPDYRRCAFPFCGGYWVERVNRTTTRCGDGTYAAQCYVAEADWSKLGLSPATVEAVTGAVHQGGGLLVRATVGTRSYEVGRLGLLKPSEAWYALGPDQPDGVFVKIEHTGVRCSAAPCPFFRERKLNGSGTASLAELGWDASGADDDAISKGLDGAIEPGLIIAGDRYTVTGPAGRGKARTVTQFYVRAVDAAEAP